VIIVTIRIIGVILRGIIGAGGIIGMVGVIRGVGIIWG